MPTPSTIIASPVLGSSPGSLVTSHTFSAANAAGSVFRTIVWNSSTNSIPAQTAPTINIAYANDRKSAVVTITCDVNDATIRYDTNGRYATTNCNSPIYSAPITVEQSTVFTACWYFNGLKSYAAHASVYLPI